jgi:hypothetical protein
MDNRAFLDTHLAIGLWLVSAGLLVSPSYGRGGFGLGTGPLLVGHIRLNNGRIQHELQPFVRCDVAVLGWKESRWQVTTGLRLLFDLG